MIVKPFSFSEKIEKSDSKNKMILPTYLPNDSNWRKKGGKPPLQKPELVKGKDLCRSSIYT